MPFGIILIIVVGLSFSLFAIITGISMLSRSTDRDAIEKRMQKDKTEGRGIAPTHATSPLLITAEIRRLRFLGVRNILVGTIISVYLLYVFI